MSEGNYKSGYDALQKSNPANREMADATAFGSGLLDDFSSTSYAHPKKMQISNLNFEDGQSLSFEPLPALYKNGQQAFKAGGEPVELSQSLNEQDLQKHRHEHHGHHHKQVEGNQADASTLSENADSLDRGGNKYVANDLSPDSLGYSAGRELAGRMKASQYFLPNDASLADVPSYQKSAYRPVQPWERALGIAATVFMPPVGLYMEANMAMRDIQRINNAGDPKDV